MTPQEALRERFEAWADTRHQGPARLRHDMDGYDYPLGRLLLEAYQAGAAVPEGWQLVPKEPDDTMQSTGAITICENKDEEPWLIAVWVYKAMLAAAPEFKP